VGSPPGPPGSGLQRLPDALRPGLRRLDGRRHPLLGRRGVGPLAPPPNRPQNRSQKIASKETCRFGVVQGYSGAEGRVFRDFFVRTCSTDRILTVPHPRGPPKVPDWGCVSLCARSPPQAPPRSPPRRPRRWWPPALACGASASSSPVPGPGPGTAIGFPSRGGGALSDQGGGSLLHAQSGHEASGKLRLAQFGRRSIPPPPTGRGRGGGRLGGGMLRTVGIGPPPHAPARSQRRIPPPRTAETPRSSIGRAPGCNGIDPQNENASSQTIAREGVYLAEF